MNLICKLFGHNHCVDDDVPPHCIRCGMADYYAEDADAYHQDAVLIKPMIWIARRVGWILRWPFRKMKEWHERRRDPGNDVPF